MGTGQTPRLPQELTGWRGRSTRGEPRCRGRMWRAMSHSALAGSRFHPTPSRRVSYGTSPLLSRHKSSGPVRSQDEVGWLESPH